MSTFRKIAALVLCLALLMSLAACGKGSDEVSDPGTLSEPRKPDNTEHPEFVYTAEFKSLDTGSDYGVGVYSGSDNGVYVGWSKKIGMDVPEGETVEYEGQYAVYENHIALMDFDGNIRELEGYQPMPRIENTEGYKAFRSYRNIDCLFPVSGGRLLVIESRNCNWNEAPEGMDENDEAYWNYYKYYRDYNIRVLNADGSEVSTNQIAIGEEDYLNTYGSVLDAQDNIVACTNTGLVAICNDGSIAYKIEGDDDAYIDSLVTLKDGTIAATTWGERGVELLPVDLESKSFGEAQPLPSGAYNLFSGGGDYDLYYNSGINLYGYDSATGEGVKLLNWMDCDIDSGSLNGIYIHNDGRIIAVLSRWSYNRHSDEQNRSTCEAAIVSKQPYESVPQKTVLTLAAQYITGSSVSNAIIRFNRSNDKCRINVRDYSEYNTGDDYSAGLTKLNTEIMAGNLPDLILMDNQMPYEQYAAKGILEDLYPYIDSDSEISRDDFFPTVMKALEVDGKLCQAASYFGIQCVMGAKSVVGDTPGWTYEQYNEALASMPEGCAGFGPFVIRDNILQTLLAADSDYYVNWGTGECKFDSPEFVDLLKFVGGFPEDYPQDEAMGDERVLISEGQQMLANGYIGGFEDLVYNGRCFGLDNVTYIGYPTHEGVGNLFSVNNGIAITKSCADKDGAWQFVRSFLTEKGQDSFNSINMPTNIKLFEHYLEKEMTPDYKKDENGGYLLNENGERIPVVRMMMPMPDGSAHEVYAISQEQADMLRELISSTTKLASYDDSIFKIVKEQAQAYFAGQKSAEEVAKLIQSKANIYVNEQR